MNRFTRWLTVGVFAAGALASCTDEQTTTNLEELSPTITPAFSTNLVNPTGGYAVVNGGKWIKYFDPGTSVGSGVIRGFLDLKDQKSEGGCGSQTDGVGCEQGLNNALEPQVWVYEQQRDTYTNDLPLNFVPVFNDPDMGYVREFVLDSNEPANDPDKPFTIEEFELYLCNDLNAPNFNLYSDIAKGTCALVYDISGINSQEEDNAPLLAIDNASGSGQKFDYRLLIPESKFEAAFPDLKLCPYNPSATDCGQYLVLWSVMGREATIDGIDYSVADGYEEMSTILRGYVTVEKTAVPSFDRTYSWTIEKSVDVDAHTLFTGQSGTSNYDIVVDRTVTDGNFKVTGTVTIENKSSDPLLIKSILDEFNDTEIALDCSFPVELAGGATLSCGYAREVSVPNGSELPDDGTNEVFVELGDGAIFSASADYTFVGVTPTTVNGNPTITVTDDYASDDTSDDLSWDPVSGYAKFEYRRTWMCDGDEGTYQNTAAITETGQVADATVNVACLDLDVTKTADASLTRTYNWTIDKTVTPATWALFNGDDGTSKYDITVTPNGFEDTGEMVTGKITITNNSTDNLPVFIAKIEDQLNDASETPGIITGCTRDGDPIEVPVPSMDPLTKLDQGSTIECSYTAEPPDNTSTSNKSTVTAYPVESGGAAKEFYGSGAIQWDQAETPVNKVINVVDDFATPAEGDEGDDKHFGPWDWAGGPKTFSYERQFFCGADAGKYTNTATIVETGQNDLAEVTVTCYGLAVTKTAAGSYDETHTWEIEKSVTPEEQWGFPGDNLPWTWTVTVSEGSEDGNWAVDGQIFVQHSHPTRWAILNSVSDIVSPDLVADVSCGVDFPYTLKAGEANKLTCSYNRALPDASDRDNTATAVLQNFSYTPDGTATTSGTTDYSGFADLEDWKVTVFNGTAKITDTQLELAELVTAGAGPWEYPGDDSHTCSMDQDDYDQGDGTYYTATVDNTGTVTGSSGQTDSDDASTTYTCYWPAQAEVVKTTTEGDEDIGEFPFTFELYDPDGNLVAFTTLGTGGGTAFFDGLKTDGTWTVKEVLPEGWVTTTETTCTFTLEFPASANQTYTCTFDNTEMSRAKVVKTTNKGTNAGYDWKFAIYGNGPHDEQGSDFLSDAPLATASTNGGDTPLTFGDLNLDPTFTYTVCEIPSMPTAGWTSEWWINGQQVPAYNPHWYDPTPQTLGYHCVDFGAGTDYPLLPGETLTFNVDNSYPGGEPRTPGYWKNWSSCSGGGQYEKATGENDPDNEFWAIDELLNDPGFTVGVMDLEPATYPDDPFALCMAAVNLLDHRDVETEKKLASDAAFDLARNMLAYLLNQAAGACPSPTAAGAAADGQALLVSIDFNGTLLRPEENKDLKNYLRPKSGDYSFALELSKTLDEYNNGQWCNK